MSDVENIRYELGKEARAKGEKLHENASEEWKRGYLKSSGRVPPGFGSNVIPRKFGRSTQQGEPWECVCGEINLSTRRRTLAGRELCWHCGQEREYVDIDLLEEQDG